MASSKEPLDVWRRYVACMMNGYTIKMCCEDCGISKKTAFDWRHRILDGREPSTENQEMLLMLDDQTGETRIFIPEE